MTYQEVSQLRNGSAVRCFSDVDSLAEQIRAACRKVRIIGIDGFCGAGKTSLARQLSQTLKVGVVSTDCHMVKKGRDLRYLDRLDLEALSNSMHQTVKANRQVILEGICLLDVMARLGISTSCGCFVYVKRISQYSDIWYDGVDLEEFEDLGMARTSSIPEPHLSVFRYHKTFNPHRSAHFVYRRIERS